MNRHSDPRILTGYTVLPPMIEDREPDTEPTCEPDPAHPRKGKPPKGKTPDAAGRFAVVNAFVDASMADLSRTELAVWLCLWRDSRDGVARTAQTYIADRCGCKRESVSRALSGLVERGLVKVVRQGGLNRGMSVYRVLGVP